MTTRQHTTWTQVSHLWGNGGTFEGEIGCALLSEEELHATKVTRLERELVSPNSLTDGHYQIWNGGLKR
jgi:hypothetical protein